MRVTVLFIIAVGALGACGETAVPTSTSDAPPQLARRQSALPARTDLGTLGGASSFAFDIDDQGMVVGSAQTQSGQFHAFRWTAADGMVDLGTLAGDVSSTALAIASGGTILGLSHSADGGTSAVVWNRRGTITELAIPLLPGASTFGVDDINARGDVVGTALYQAEFIISHGFVWNPRSGITDIGAQLDNTFESASSAVNNHGLVLGIQGGGVLRTFLWEPASGPRYLPVPGTAPLRTELAGLGLNQHGDVAGWAVLIPVPEEPNLGLVPPFTDFGSHALVWTRRSGFRFLPPLPGGCCSVASDLNAHRLAVGQSFVSDAFQAVAWPAAGGVISLNSSDPNPSVANAVNQHGVAAGWTSLDPEGGVSHATVWNIAEGTVSAAPGIAGADLRRSPRGPPEFAAAKGSPFACLTDWHILATKARLASCVEGRLAPSNGR